MTKAFRMDSDIYLILTTDSAPEGCTRYTIYDQEEGKPVDSSFWETRPESEDEIIELVLTITEEYGLGTKNGMVMLNSEETEEICNEI